MRYEVQTYNEILLTWKTGKKYETLEQAKKILKDNQRVFDMKKKQPIASVV